MRLRMMVAIAALAVLGTVPAAAAAKSSEVAPDAQRTQKAEPLVPLPTPLSSPARERRRARVTVSFTLRDARLVGHRHRVRLSGRPAGRGRVVIRARRTRRLHVHARALAGTLRGLGGRTARLRARVAGRRVRLSHPRLRSGRFVARVAGGRRHARRLGRIVLTARVRRGAVPVRGSCMIVPFASCPRARMDMGDLLLADLRGADLRHARLQRAFANSADLSGADLRESDLRGADLSSADLRDADLRRADLADATLKGAEIGGARLAGAYLCRTLMPGGKKRSMRDCGKPAPTHHRHLAKRRLRRLPRHHDRGARLARLGVKRHRPARVNHRRLSRVRRDSPLGRRLAEQPREARAHRRVFAKRRRGFASRGRGSGKPQAALAGSATPLHAPATCKYKPTQDTDRDGLTDCWEIAPHTVQVVTALDLNRGSAQGSSQSYTTNRTRKDTDGDGLSDLKEEQTAASNPARPDSDGDGLRDGDEYNAYLSHPNNADSDGDSEPTGKPRSRFLYDGAETKVGSSPIADDSDGDGLTDYSEITDGDADTSPIVANLPTFSVGPDPGTNVNINVPTEITVGTKKTTQTETATMKTKESSESHSTSVKFGFSFSQQFEIKNKVGVPFNEASYQAKVGAKESFSRGTTNSWESTKSSEQEYRKLQAEEQSKEVTTKPTGCVGAEMTIRNTSDTRGFELDGSTQILAEVPDPSASPAKPRANILATLLPINGEPRVGDCPGNDPHVKISLGPGESKQVGFSGVGDSQDLIAYLANPAPITFVTGNYNITNLDNTDQPFSTTEAEVNKRDSAVIVDYGDAKSGTGRLAQYEVFTGLKVKPGTPNAAGTSIGTILTALGLDPRYGGGTSGRANLAGLGGVANAAHPNDGLWTALGSAKGIADDDVDFPDITLVPGEGSNIFLTYLTDGDNDGVPDNNEHQSGTSTHSKDTDADGLPDKLETERGWLVALAKGPKPAYHVYSSPLSCDADGDGSPDGPGQGNKTAGMCPKGPPEYQRAKAVGSTPDDLLQLGTDPKQADTNLDGVSDGRESYPQVLEYVPPNARAPQWLGTFGGKGNGGGKFLRPEALSVNPGVAGAGSEPGGSLMVDDPPGKVVQKMMLTNIDPANPDYSSQVGPFFRLTSGTWPHGAVVSPLTTSHGSSSSKTNPAQKGHVVWVAHKSDRDLHVHQYNAATLHSSGDSFNACEFDRLPFVNPNHIDRDAVTAFMDTDNAGNIYVATAQNALGANKKGLRLDGLVSCVAEYRPDGHKVRDFGRKYISGQGLPPASSDVTNPTGIAVGPNGNVFVADNVQGSPSFQQGRLVPENVRAGVRKFDSESGRPMPGFVSTAQGDPSGVGVDGNGFVYVLDGHSGLVFKLSNSLTYLNTFGGKGSGNGRFKHPVDIAADPGGPVGKWNGNLYVLDQKTGLIQVFNYPHGEEPAAGTSR